MRAFILTLALAAPLALVGCQSEEADAIEDQGEAIDEAYEDAGMDDTGDAIEEQYDEAAEEVDEAIEDGAPVGDQEDVIGDGEVIDEPGEPEM
ncbi:hypothetical protein [Rubrivirga marina]|uniref:Uncharacterized protein n=1 Tax=Rubrivirga marina TaxID=1196024 RepID=A0A271J3E2_9BACT|nr:hypothetical protein [Rubrivirga marina]PAP77564.1 hypothetical protein BSZ37_14490 [Rubrivirga marina]